MKRKTNLFYTSGPDSKFLTFSNYTEALTGNFLSVNTKLFPDKFLCLKLKGLNSNTKENFINYLAAYYENKLAALRDKQISNNKTVETHIYPLAYLLEAILNVSTYNNVTNEFELNANIEKNTESIYELSSFNDFITDGITDLVRYVGDVTEYDYNGTYTDIICNVNLNSYNEGILTVKNFNKEIKESVSFEDTGINSDARNLYGWGNDQIIIDNANKITPVFDSEHTYYNNVYIEQLKYKRITHSKTLSFNIIIPLFSFINIDVNSNENIINELSNDINLNSETSAIMNVPLGIWINADKTEDTFIELEKDINLDAYPSWSLLISTQFKPFPYGNHIIKENTTPQSTLNSFNTFAEILSKMNNVLNNFDEVNNKIMYLTNRINEVETQLKSIATETRINKFDKDLQDMRSSINQEIKDLKQHIVNLKWSNVG